jgi:signal transduction histidine kinase
MVTNTPGVPAAAQRWHRFPNVPGLPYADVIAACEPLFITTRAEYEARFPALRDTLAATDLAASATLPMGVEGRVIGAISFDFAAEREFDADDRALLATLCRQCAQAIERARLYEAEHAARADAEMLRSDAEEARARAEDARRRADDANQAKSAFLATMSHELRTPLNAIGGYAELLDLGVRGPVTAAQHQDLARIRRAGAYLLGLINDVLNFVQLESAQVRYSVRDLSVNTALQDAAALIEPQTRQKGIHFVCEPCPHDWTMRADGDKVQQVLLNLLSNAVKFTLEGGQVVLSCLGREAPYGTPDGSVRIAVRDTGSGIPADKLEQIFEPFVQIGRELRNPVAGVGLGLAISRELARGMGGNLTADSTVGAGSTFTVVLPRPPDPLP